MKLLIITALIMMLIWQGCYSYYSVNPFWRSQKINLNDYDAEDIRLDLVDGTEITSQAYTHKLVAEPSDFIMGIGTLTYEGQTNNKKTFYSYNANEFESVKTEKINGKDYVTCYLNSGVQIHYEDDSYLRLSPKEGTGYFIRGEIEKDGIKEIKTSRVELNKIKNVEIKKINVPNTVGVTILTLGILFVGLFVLTFDGPFGSKRYPY